MNEMLERDYSEGNEGDGVNGQLDGSPYQRRPRNLFFFFFFFFFISFVENLCSRAVGRSSWKRKNKLLVLTSMPGLRERFWREIGREEIWWWCERSGKWKRRGDGRDGRIRGEEKSRCHLSLCLCGLWQLSIIYLKPKEKIRQRVAIHAILPVHARRERFPDVAFMARAYVNFMAADNENCLVWGPPSYDNFWGCVFQKLTPDLKKKKKN